MTSRSVPRLMPLNAVRTRAWPASTGGSAHDRISTVPGAVYQMARAAGLNKEDGSAIIKVLEQLAGVQVKA